MSPLALRLPNRWARRLGAGRQQSLSWYRLHCSHLPPAVASALEDAEFFATTSADVAKELGLKAEGGEQQQ